MTIVQTSLLVESDVHLLVTPMTYAQYTARSATDSSLYHQLIHTIEADQEQQPVILASALACC